MPVIQCSPERSHLAAAAEAYRDGLPTQNIPRNLGVRATKPRHISTSAKVSLPCVFEGAIREWCTAKCNKTAELHHVRDCDIHDTCTRVKCASCNDRIPDLGPWKQRNKVTSFLAAQDVKIAAGNFLHSLDAPPQWEHDRGVVICGGGSYACSAYVTIKALRHVGYKGPIQLWHYDGEEVPTVEGVTNVNATKHHAPRRHLHKYNIKTYAVMNAPFRKVLLLDADSYPVQPIDRLFDYEAVFFPDLPNTDKWTEWEKGWLLPRRNNASYETGQYVIDKKALWPVASLARWYDDHSDFTWFWDLGDKGPWRASFAWHGLIDPFPQPRPVWDGPAFRQLDFSGTTLFVHRCRDKFRERPYVYYTGQRGHNNTYAPQLPLEDECHQWAKEYAEMCSVDCAAVPPCSPFLVP